MERMSEAYRAALGASVRARREACSMSQQTLAHESRTQAKVISTLESGARDTSAGVVERVAAALGCSLGELYSDADRRLK